jgi:hypothetical protein
MLNWDLEQQACKCKIQTANKRNQTHRAEVWTITDDFSSVFDNSRKKEMIW